MDIFLLGLIIVGISILIVTIIKSMTKNKMNDFD